MLGFGESAGVTPRGFTQLLSENVAASLQEATGQRPLVVAVPARTRWSPPSGRAPSGGFAFAVACGGQARRWARPAFSATLRATYVTGVQTFGRSPSSQQETP